MKQIFVEPLDVLMFRDGRPFSAGDDHTAVGVFPPSPNMVYGALRAAILSRHKAVFSKHGYEIAGQTVQMEVGSPKHLGTLTIRHFSLGFRRNGRAIPLLPVPADVLKEKDQAEHRIRLQPVESAISNLPGNLSILWNSDMDARVFFEAVTGWYSDDAFADYLMGKVQAPFKAPMLWDTDSEELKEEFEKPYLNAPRVSVRLDRQSRTASEGNLFRVGFSRLHPTVGLLMGLENASSMDSQGWVRLGGESRSGYFQSCTFSNAIGNVHDTVLQKVRADRKFRLILATPTPFTSGWLPHFVDSKTFEGKLGACRVLLTGAAVKRYQHLGGWDMVRGRPKITRRAVPAGSVYFFDLKEGDPASLFQTVFGRSICQDPDDEKQGLGIAYLGVG